MDVTGNEETNCLADCHSVSIFFHRFCPAGQKKEKVADTSRYKVTIERAENGFPSAKFTSENYQSERVLHDTDGDGWCDIWCILFKNEVKHRDKTIDSDQDGLTDYQEMVLMRSPTVAQAPPRKFTAADRANAQEKAQIRFIESQKKWVKMIREKKGLQRMIRPEDRLTNPRVSQLSQKIEKLKLEAVELGLKAPFKRIELEEQARELGIPMTEVMPEGYSRSFRGESDGVPIYTRSNNRLAAASISADELWAPSLTPWASGSTGLELDGSDVTVSLFENDGGVNVNHLSFGGRITQRDSANVDTTGHATQVAGTMVGFSTTNPEITGVAFASDVEAFSLDNLASNRAGVAAGSPTQGGQVVTLSNNSWSIVQGWGLVNFGGAIRWFFYGAGAPKRFLRLKRNQ